jgi:hypothetical protein
MNMHPVMLLMLANSRTRELIAEADQRRLLASAREARRTRKAGAVRGRPTSTQPTSTLASCDPSAAVPAR